MVHFHLIFISSQHIAKICCVCITIILTILSGDDPKESSLDLIFWCLCKNGLGKRYDFGVFDVGVVMTGDLINDEAVEVSLMNVDLMDDKERESLL